MRETYYWVAVAVMNVETHVHLHLEQHTSQFFACHIKYQRETFSAVTSIHSSSVELQLAVGSFIRQIESSFVV